MSKTYDLPIKLKGGVPATLIVSKIVGYPGAVSAKTGKARTILTAQGKIDGTGAKASRIISKETRKKIKDAGVSGGRGQSKPKKAKKAGPKKAPKYGPKNKPKAKKYGPVLPRTVRKAMAEAKKAEKNLAKQIAVSEQ
jgi:hypothetical protein